MLHFFTKNPYVIMFSLYWRFIPSRKKAIAFMLMQLISRILPLLGPYFFGQLLNTVQLGGIGMLYNVLLYLGILVLLTLTTWLFHGPSRIREMQLSFEVTKNYQLYLYHCATSLPLEWHTNNHSGDIIDRINKAKNAMSDFSNHIYSSLGTFVSFTGALIALMIIWPILGLFLITLAVVIISIIVQFDKKIVQWIKEENKLGHRVGGLFVDYLTNIKTLITLRFLEPTEKNISDGIDTMYNPYNKHVMRNEQKWFTTESLLQTSLMIIVGAYIYYNRSNTGVVVIGTVTMIYQYTDRVSNTFYNIAWQYSDMVRNVAHIQSVSDIEKTYLDLQTKLIHNNIGEWSLIKIQNLNFNYKDKNNILSNIEIDWSKGERIALVGESGSGKSTLLSLLRGLHAVDDVKLLIDGQTFNSLEPLFSHTSLIPQEPEIFEESIEFNITMGSQVSQERLQKYSQIAMFHNIAENLPNGYNTHIKEKGVNLSGGQKQRLALARGLLASVDSDIVLLDESTSSVDSINEKKIYQNIFETFTNKTIIAAIHKLHLLTLFDKIYVFDQGNIVEQGTFKELISNSGYFQKLREEYQVTIEDI